ncbi:MAG: TIGR00730 family Rossman fold protein, partial [Burkholderiales bacterium]
MPGITSVTVYCGSAPGSDPAYLKLAAIDGAPAALGDGLAEIGGG